MNTLVFWETLLEQSYDTRKLIKEFAKLREQYELLKKSTSKKIDKLEKDLAYKTI